MFNTDKKSVIFQTQKYKNNSNIDKSVNAKFYISSHSELIINANSELHLLFFLLFTRGLLSTYYFSPNFSLLDFNILQVFSDIIFCNRNISFFHHLYI